MAVTPEQVAQKSQALYEAITQACLSKARLTNVRQDRDASAEETFDAAGDFRKKEQAIGQALIDLMDLQVQALLEAGS